MAKIYASRGCPLVLTARSEKPLQDLVQELTQTYKNMQIFYVTGDSTKESDCDAIVDFTIRKFGRIDITVLSAGLGLIRRFDESPDVGEFKKLMDVNLFGYVNMTKYLLPHLKTSKGQIVVISSLSGYFATPTRAAYCSTKFAVNGFFQCL